MQKCFIFIQNIELFINSSKLLCNWSWVRDHSNRSHNFSKISISNNSWRFITYS